MLALNCLHGHWVKLPSYLCTRRHSDLKKIKSYNDRRIVFCTSLSVTCPVAGSGGLSDAYLSPYCGGQLLTSAQLFAVEDIVGGVTGESGRPGDKDVKELRYTSEVFFARVTTATILKDSVSYRRLNILEVAVNLTCEFVCSAVTFR